MKTPRRPGPDTVAVEEQVANPLIPPGLRLPHHRSTTRHLASMYPVTTSPNSTSSDNDAHQHRQPPPPPTRLLRAPTNTSTSVNRAFKTKPQPYNRTSTPEPQSADFFRRKSLVEQSGDHGFSHERSVAFTGPVSA